MKWLGIVGAVIAGLYCAYLYAYPSVTVRYRLAVDIDVDGATHTGVGVLQVTYAKVIGVPGSNVQQRIEVKGEAIPVDMGSRGTLFVLVEQGSGRYSSPERTLPKAFGFPFGLVEVPPSADYERLRTLSGRRNVAAEDLPLLVRFRDVDDPKTVERVDPNDLAGSFGAGVYLKRVTVEITTDLVTMGIETKLPWLGVLRSRGATLDGDTSVARTSNELANRLGPGSFQAGVK